MKVLHVVNSLERGGLERFVVDLAIEQRRVGDCPDVLCLSSLGSLTDELTSAGIAVHFVDKRRTLDYRALRTFSDRIGKGNYSILHTHNTLPNYYTCLVAALLRKRTPILNTKHNMGTRDQVGIGGLLYRWSMRRTDAVVGVSGNVLAQLIEHKVVRAHRCSVIHNGIAIRRSPCGDGECRSRNRKILGIPQDALVLGTVGRMVPVKAHDLLLRSFVVLKRKYRALHLVIIGEGPMRRQLEEFIEQSGLRQDVSMPGERSDVSDLLPLFDIFVLPSHSEGHPIVLLEAAAAGLPIVATEVGGNAEIVRQAQGGTLVPAADMRALCESIELLIEREDLRTEYGRSASEWAIAHASIVRPADQYRSLYLQLSRTSTTRYDW